MCLFTSLLTKKKNGRYAFYRPLLHVACDLTFVQRLRRSVVTVDTNAGSNLVRINLTPRNRLHIHRHQECNTFSARRCRQGSNINAVPLIGIDHRAQIDGELFTSLLHAIQNGLHQGALVEVDVSTSVDGGAIVTILRVIEHSGYDSIRSIISLVHHMCLERVLPTG